MQEPAVRYLTLSRARPNSTLTPDHLFCLRTPKWTLSAPEWNLKSLCITSCEKNTPILHVCETNHPKMSIVAPWSPKLTPKWSPKWSQGNNGRPLRNMHKHGWIACPPPLGEPHFSSSFKDPNNIIKHLTYRPPKAVYREFI